MMQRQWWCGRLACAIFVPAMLMAQDAAVPRLEKRGQATQLIVDGKPFLMLAGELHNTASSNLEYMKTVWPELAKAHLNTVLVGVSWDWIEPEPGKYDFRSIDAALESARQYDLRLVWLWFGSWKNSVSSYAPVWVKVDQKRYPRVQVRDGKTVEILSALSETNCDADAKAFAALMRHTREVDRTHRVIMVQVENEVGVLGDARDRSAAANEVFARPVPQALMDYLGQHKSALLPEFAAVWQGAGGKSAGTWTQVFGTGPQADEIFQAWHYARFINRVAEAGKKEYPLPMYVNAWLVQPEDKTPGDYPSGGPQAQVHDLWRAGAPAVDMLCPDVYLPKFAEIVAQYGRSGNPRFVPESFAGARGAANAFLEVGTFAGMGYSPFGIDTLVKTEADRAPIASAYEVLAQLTPLIAEHQADGTIAAIALNKEHPDGEVRLGAYTMKATLTRSWRTPNVVPDITGYALIIATGPDEYWMAGDNLQIVFSPPGHEIAGLARQEAGRFENGKWVVTRYLAGDDSMLRYDLAAAAAEGQSGSGVKLSQGERGIQRVQLYRYQ